MCLTKAGKNVNVMYNELSEVIVRQKAAVKRSDTLAYSWSMTEVHHVCMVVTGTTTVSSVPHAGRHHQEVNLRALLYGRRHQDFAPAAISCEINWKTISCGAQNEYIEHVTKHQINPFSQISHINQHIILSFQNNIILSFQNKSAVQIRRRSVQHTPSSN